MASLSIYNVLISFLGGILSFLSPCVLPLVPGYISLMSGVSVNQLKGAEGSTAAARRAVIFNSLAFSAGLSLIFLILGGAAGLVGAAITSNPYIRIIGGIVIIIFGLHLIGAFKISTLYKDTRFLDNNDKPNNLFGSFTLGLAFAAGWTPCIGPILGGIIGLAATSGGWQSGLILAAFYSVGLALPFLLVGLFINSFLNFYKGFKRYLHTVEIVSGVLLILIGLLVATNYVTILNSSSVAAILPNAEGLVKLDESKKTVEKVDNADSPEVQAELDKKFARAPEYNFQTLDGKNVDLSSLRGKVVLLNFWATWCVPCRSEIPTLGDIQKDLGSDKLEVIGVTFDDSQSEVKEFQKDLPMQYTVATAKGTPKDAFAVVGLPTTFIIDKQGRIREKILAPRTREQFTEILKPLVEEKSPVAQK